MDGVVITQYPELSSSGLLPEVSVPVDEFDPVPVLSPLPALELPEPDVDVPEFLMITNDS